MRYTSIAGLSSERRIPRVGKIRLGEKVVSERGDGSTSERPKATDHFVVPPEVAAVFGEQPTALDVMFASDDITAIFPVSYKFYRRALLWCTGNGQQASRVDEEGKGFAELECPCEYLGQKNACRHSGSLMLMIPRVSIGGVYQLDTPSRNNIIAIQSGIEHARSLLGRISWVPFTLTLSPRQMLADGKMKTVHLVNLVLASFEQIQQSRLQLQSLRALVAPTSNEPVALISEPDDAVDEHDVVTTTGVEEDGSESQAGPAPEAPASAPAPALAGSAALEKEIRDLAARLGKTPGATNVALGTAARRKTMPLLLQELQRQAAGGSGAPIDWAGTTPGVSTALPPDTAKMVELLYGLGSALKLTDKQVSARVKSVKEAGDAAVKGLYEDWAGQVVALRTGAA